MNYNLYWKKSGISMIRSAYFFVICRLLFVWLPTTQFKSILDHQTNLRLANADLASWVSITVLDGPISPFEAGKTVKSWQGMWTWLWTSQCVKNFTSLVDLPHWVIVKHCFICLYTLRGGPDRCIRAVFKLDLSNYWGICKVIEIYYVTAEYCSDYPPK